MASAMCVMVPLLRSVSLWVGRSIILEADCVIYVKEFLLEISTRGVSYIEPREFYCVFATNVN